MYEGTNTEDLKSETRSDLSLETWRKLADKDAQGFKWNNGLLMKRSKDDIYNCVDKIVLPQEFRSRILTLAHEKCEHFGRKKMMDLVKRKFLWPQMSGDVNSNCRSCQQCQRVNKS